MTYELHVNVTASYYYCANPDVPATEAGCPKADWIFLRTETFKDQENEWTHHFSFGDITRWLRSHRLPSRGSTPSGGSPPVPV